MQIHKSKLLLFNTAFFGFASSLVFLFLITAAILRIQKNLKGGLVYNTFAGMNQPNQHLISHLLFTSECSRYSPAQCQECAFLKMSLDLPKSVLWARQIPALSRSSISRQSCLAILSHTRVAASHYTALALHLRNLKGIFSLCHFKGFRDSVDHCFLCTFCRLSPFLVFPWWTCRHRLHPFSGWFSLACATSRWSPPAGQVPLAPPHPRSTSQAASHPPSTGGWWFILHNHNIGDFGCTRAQKNKTAHPRPPKVPPHFFGWGQWAHLEHTESIFLLIHRWRPHKILVSERWKVKNRHNCKDRLLQISLFLVSLLNY